MKKTISLILVVMFLGHPAHSSVNPLPADHSDLIAKTIDQFRYQVTADPDANDPAFQARAIESFRQQFQKLQQQGVSGGEMMDYVRNSLLDASARHDFDRMLSTIHSKTLTGEEAVVLAMGFMENHYQQGASFRGTHLFQTSGGRAALIVGLVAIVAVVTLIVSKQDRT